MPTLPEPVIVPKTCEIGIMYCTYTVYLSFQVEIDIETVVTIIDFRLSNYRKYRTWG